VFSFFVNALSGSVRCFASVGAFLVVQCVRVVVGVCAGMGGERVGGAVFRRPQRCIVRPPCWCLPFEWVSRRNLQLL